MSDKSRPHSRQYPLMQSSTTFGFSVIFLLCASCPGCPPGLRPLFFRKDFVRRITSAFIFSLEGGVLLLFEFLSGFSYFSSRLRRLRFSFWSLSTLRRKFAFSVCSASMASCIHSISDVSLFKACDISVTCLFIDTKVQKISEISKNKV